MAVTICDELRYGKKKRSCERWNSTTLMDVDVERTMG